MFTTGLPGISLGLFSAASEAVAIPTGVQIFCFLATLLVGRVVRSTAMLFIFGGMATFVIGGLTGVMVALVPFDFQAHDTYFVVSHLHYVLVGGTIFPIVAGCYYFFPLLSGKKLSERLGRWAFWLMLIGFNVTFFPIHLTGLLGLPRRVFTYPADMGFDELNLTSSIGAFVLAGGFLVFLWDIVRPKGKQPLSERNPWGAGTLEWLAQMPDKPWGTRSIPEIDGRYPLWDQPNFMRDVDQGRFFLPDAEEGKRETIVTSAIDARPLQCLRVPGPTFLTLIAAVFTGGFFILATFHWWWPALASGLLALGTILGWLWTGTAPIPEKEEKHVGLGLTLPLYASGPESVGWWAMFITMLGDMTAFISLVFGYFFYWTGHDDFPPESSPGAGTGWLLSAGASLLFAWALAGRSEPTPIADLLEPESVPPAVVENCGRCHAVDGQGRGEGAFPRLAGQQVKYFTATLEAYARGARHSGIMEPIAAGLTSAERRQLAQYYGGLDVAEPASADPVAAEMIARGELIARRGIPAQKVPACADCHGPAEHAPNPHYPVLAGQDDHYLVLQLQLFKQQHRGGASYAHLMDPVAKHLTASQMRAVALYYESLSAD